MSQSDPFTEIREAPASVILGWSLADLRTRAESSAKAECTRTSCLEPEVHELAAFVLALCDRLATLEREAAERETALAETEAACLANSEKLTWLRRLVRSRSFSSLSDEDFRATRDLLDRLDAAALASPEAAAAEPRKASWTCRHGSTYTGSDDFISGARNAHDEIAGWMRPSSENDRSTNDIAYEILQAAPQVEALVEEWFAVESRARIRMLEAAALPAVDAAPPIATQVDRIPSHRSDELPRYIQIDRLSFAVNAEYMTGAQIRYLPTPPLGDAYDLFQHGGASETDRIVRDDEVVNLRGARFFSVPKIINAGAVDAPPEPTT